MHHAVRLHSRRWEASDRPADGDAGFAALHDVALLSAMYGLLAAAAHAFAPLLADRLRSGDYTQGVVSYRRRVTA